MENKHLVYNSITCLECNEELISYYTHDYKSCNCNNNASIDGGTDYIKFSAKNINNIKFLTIYNDEPFELVRKYAVRGSRGINGDEPLIWIKICDMSDEHLKAVIEYGGANWHINLIKKEIEFRKNNI